MLAFRLLLVDEDASYRWDLKQGLERDPGLNVIAEASNSHEALSLTDAQRPDLVLIGRRLPGLNGVQTSAAIRYHHPGTRVLMLVPVADYDQCLAAVQAGASGILPRYGDHQKLRSTVRAVLAGSDLIQPWAGCEGLVIPATLSEQPAAMELAGVLTPRELEAFDCLLMGLSTKETAVTLGIADQTVKNRISSVLHKLRLEGRMGAVRLALIRGWTEYGPVPHLDPVTTTEVKGTDRLELPVPPTMLPLSGEQAAWA